MQNIANCTKSTKVDIDLKQAEKTSKRATGIGRTTMQATTSPGRQHPQPARGPIWDTIIQESTLQTQREGMWLHYIRKQSNHSANTPGLNTCRNSLHISERMSQYMAFVSEHINTMFIMFFHRQVSTTCIYRTQGKGLCRKEKLNCKELNFMTVRRTKPMHCILRLITISRIRCSPHALLTLPI